MLYYLDSVILIYAIDGNFINRQRASNHLLQLEQAGHRFLISELTRTECLAQVMGRQSSAQQLLQFMRYFQSPNIRTLSLTNTIMERASSIRGGYYSPAVALPRKYSLVDSIHLAAAIEARCDVFLTNDLRLASFPGLTMEMLPDIPEAPPSST